MPSAFIKLVLLKCLEANFANVIFAKFVDYLFKGLNRINFYGVKCFIWQPVAKTNSRTIVSIGFNIVDKMHYFPFLVASESFA